MNNAISDEFVLPTEMEIKRYLLMHVSILSDVSFSVIERNDLSGIRTLTKCFIPRQKSVGIRMSYDTFISKVSAS